MIVYKVSDESFLTHKVSKLYARIKCFSDLCTNTDTGSIFFFFEVIHDILVGPLFHGGSVMWAHASTETEKHQTIKIIYFCNGPDRRAGIVSNCLLFDTDSRGQTSNFFYLCLLRHTSDKHTSIGRE